MVLTFSRGIEGVEKSAVTGREGGQISYIKGSIGDKPVLDEVFLFGSNLMQDDTFGLSDFMLQCFGSCLTENLELNETYVITNG